MKTVSGYVRLIKGKQFKREDNNIIVDEWIAVYISETNDIASEICSAVLKLKILVDLEHSTIFIFNILHTYMVL